ncbi:lipocalin-like domain-containing protein [Thalassotalea sp. ND16A]|uniref:lipocalin-like domain-containing protein n=1 Tax=Thalassotalea sp. ND16A TaxID=1535422 RepID=UPI00051D5873|nr:lipocalin-like domain-containing protein [Thalassotalea sp. ND16A]KGJ95718.1 hypothetical protein ND16A_1253 [Thalassotalea sp. ND16A]
MKLPLLLSLSLFYLAGCEQQPKPDNNPLAHLAATADRYQQATAGKPIKFPEDHSPHKNYRHEWWYLTANLKTESGQPMAAQWTLFRTSVSPRHWYFAHATLADKERHLSAFRHGRQEFGNVTFTTKPFSAQIDDWLWQSATDLLPARLQFGEPFNASEPWQAELSLAREHSKPLPASLKPQFFLQGEQGFSRKHASLNIASHYYSQPFIDVAGRVFWQGKWQGVSGKAWFDREWGSQMLAADQRGWDWFSLRLDQNTALMVYRIRSNINDYVYGNLMYRNGSSQALVSEQILLNSITDQGGAYPNGFRLIIDHERVDIEIKVVNRKQINRFGIEYFEGMATFTGSHQGEGFVEMTGYQ